MAPSVLLTYLGGLVLLKALYDLVRFLSLYIQPPTLHKFLYGRAPYALVTGASDGIGKAIAQELYNRGFNVIVHGRNQSKLQQVAAEVKGSGTRDVRTWVADANSATLDFVKEVEQWEDLEITLVVHNVGGAPPRPERIDQVPEEDLRKDIQRNALFPFFLTRALLPKLRRASGPVQIVYLGSGAGAGPIQRLPAYGPSKSFLRAFSSNVDVDEQFWIPTNVSAMHVMIGNVQSKSHKVALSLFSPTAERFARLTVECIGCGKRDVTPYLPHAFQLWIATLFPENFVDQLKARAMEEELRLIKKNGHNW